MFHLKALCNKAKQPKQKQPIGLTYIQFNIQGHMAVDSVIEMHNSGEESRPPSRPSSYEPAGLSRYDVDASMYRPDCDAPPYLEAGRGEMHKSQIARHFQREESREEELHDVSELSLSQEEDQASPEPLEGREGGVTSSSPRSNRVQMEDLGYEESINFTTSTLRKCKKLVLRPYWGLLVFIGWRAFGKDSIHTHTSQCHRYRYLNMFYPVMVMLCLLYAYMYEILDCDWKMDDNIDTTGDVPTQRPVYTSVGTSPSSNGSFHLLTSPSSNISLESIMYANSTIRQLNMTSSKLKTFGCDHIVTNYFVPNCLHLIAYLIGFYYFRIQENEQLYALMEKVFLQATVVQTRSASQQRMIHKLKSHMIIGLLWVFITVVIDCLYVYDFQLPVDNMKEVHGEVSISATGLWILLVFKMVGAILFNCVILVVVVNFSTQCEMIKFYVRGLALRLHEKSTDIKTAMKDVLVLRQSLGVLNGIISKMTSLVSFILAELTIIGICMLIQNKDDVLKRWLYYGLFPFVKSLMLCFPLFQVARMNSVCLRISKIAVEMRVFGYKGASIIDLDSFLHFVKTTKLKGKLFHITVRASHLISVMIVTALVFIILFQTTVLNIPQNVF